MVNEIYMHNVNRDYWTESSSSRSGDVEVSSSSSMATTGAKQSTPCHWSGAVKSDSSNSMKFDHPKQLEISTYKFLPKNYLAKYNSGPVVYKGWVDEKKLTTGEAGSGRGIPVAVEMDLQGRIKSDKEWLAKYNFLRRLDHPNLTRLIGHCVGNHLLVYEFMDLGSLDKHLFNVDDCVLTWSLRMKVALGVANALAFLHKDDINVIHLGVVSSNILLDSNYNPKLSNFGLAIEGPIGDMNSTALTGMVGYIDPEFRESGKATPKSDVYGFGVVLLEIIYGQRTFDMWNDGIDLAEWAKLQNEELKIFKVLDCRLKGNYPLIEAQKAASLALRCVATQGKFRPNMSQVVVALEQLQDLEMCEEIIEQEVDEIKLLERCLLSNMKLFPKLMEQLQDLRQGTNLNLLNLLSKVMEQLQDLETNMATQVLDEIKHLERCLHSDRCLALNLLPKVTEDLRQVIHTNGN